MGTIIPITFGRRRRRRDDEARNRGADEIERMVRDAAYVRDHPDRMHAAAIRADAIAACLLELHWFWKSVGWFELRVKRVGRVSLETLCEYLLDSYAQDWKRQPQFYGAVVLEFHERREASKQLSRTPF